jgi:hypothetical protein
MNGEFDLPKPDDDDEVEQRRRKDLNRDVSALYPDELRRWLSARFGR